MPDYTRVIKKKKPSIQKALYIGIGITVLFIAIVFFISSKDLSQIPQTVSQFSSEISRESAAEASGTNVTDIIDTYRKQIQNTLDTYFTDRLVVYGSTNPEAVRTLQERTRATLLSLSTPREYLETHLRFVVTFDQLLADGSTEALEQEIQKQYTEFVRHMP